MSINISIQSAVARRLGLDNKIKPAGMDYSQSLSLPISSPPRRLPLLPRPNKKGIAGVPIA